MPPARIDLRKGKDANYRREVSRFVYKPWFPSAGRRTIAFR
jgi:hypothetical protein